jgi:SpoVK/Ycf46/Vps4 family AAA+-type ATPase
MFRYLYKVKIQGIPQSISAPEDDEILVHPSTLASIEGIFSSDNGQPLNECIVSLWRFKRNISGKRSMKNEQSISKHKSRVRVCHLKCSIDILPNCAVLTENVRKYLDVPLMGRIQLRVLGVPPSLPESFEVHVDKALIPDEVRDTFLKWSSSLESARLIHSNSTLRLTLPSGAVVTATIIPQYLNTTESGEESLFDDAPIGAIEKYAYLGGKTGITLSNSNVKVIRSKSITRHKVCNSSNLGRAKIHSISYMKNVHEKICMNYKCLLVGEYAAYRILIGARPPGSVVLHGSKGCGKTNVLKAFLDEYQSNPMSMCFGIFVDCRDLRGLKMESVKSRLTDIFEQAALNAPSLIALDNLDALAPEENEGGGPANEQSCRLAEHLLHLMQQNQKKMWKNTQELQASVKEWRISFKKTSHSSDSSSEVSSTFASALQASALSKSVGVICSSRSNSSFHKSLRRCGLFDRPINIPSPDSEQRENLIRSILETKTREIDKSLSKTFLFDSSLDFTHLSSLMEGYCLRDLGNVVDRALHKSIVDSSKKGSTEIRIIHEHFSAGLDSFQPSALVGVDLFKSSVLWSDIGGLHQVRTILKDTLELPTRYGKLYENSPIKLPSGMMLYGPPGCGKTLLASAVANECGLKLISVKGPEVLNKYIGASEQAIRDLFARAAAAAPSVLFLDEFDSIAPRRGADNTGVTDRLVNQLLTFLDGVESRGVSDFFKKTLETLLIPLYREFMY